MSGAPEFLRPVRAESLKLGNNESKIRVRPSIRLYSTQRQAAWNLQIFAPMMIGPGGCRVGKDDAVSTAAMTRKDLVALRDAITAALEGV